MKVCSEDDYLTLDVSDLALTAVVCVGREIWVRGEGGSGYWRGEDGLHVHVEEVTDMDFRLHLSDETPNDLFDSYVSWLEKRRDDGSKMRLMLADDRLGRLTDQYGSWIPIPTRPFPAQTEVSNG